MKCPKCGVDHDKVVDSRPSDELVRRRRVCLSCGHKWSTLEMTEEEYRKAMASRESNRVRAKAANLARRGFEIPDGLLEQYRYLTRIQGLRAKEAGIALGIIKDKPASHVHGNGSSRRKEEHVLPPERRGSGHGG